MTATYGMKKTLSAASQDLHIGIEDLIIKYPSPRIELVKRWNSKVFTKPVTSHKYEWSTRGNRGVKAKITADILADATSMTVDTAGVFNIDDVFMTADDGRLFRVTSVTSGTTIDFHPVDSAKPMQAHSSGYEMKVVGVAAPQGADADDMVTIGFEDLYNYTQIFEDVVDLSGTEHASLIRGELSSAKLLTEKHQELLEKLNSTLIVGQRFKDTTRDITYAGGLDYFIDSNNVVDFGGSATWSNDSSVIEKIDDALDYVSNKVKNKPVMFVGAKFMRKFKYVQSSLGRAPFENKQRGIGVVDTYLSHLYGDIDVVLIQDRVGLLDNTVYIADESLLGYKALRPWKTYPLAKTGDSFKWQIVGEYTFKLNLPKSAAKITNLGL